MKNDIPKKGKCFTVQHSTGCTCCSYKNYASNLYLNRDAAQDYANNSLKTSTIGSQYADSGVHNVVELDYELAEPWIILNYGKEALKFEGFSDDAEAGYPYYHLSNNY